MQSVDRKAELRHTAKRQSSALLLSIIAGAVYLLYLYFYGNQLEVYGPAYPIQISPLPYP